MSPIDPKNGVNIRSKYVLSFMTNEKYCYLKNRDAPTGRQKSSNYISAPRNCFDTNCQSNGVYYKDVNGFFSRKIFNLIPSNSNSIPGVTNINTCDSICQIIPRNGYYRYRAV